MLTEAIAIILKHKSNLADWLNTHKHTDHVGRLTDGSSCPIATYLEQKLRSQGHAIDRVLVGTRAVTVIAQYLEDGVQVELPTWTQHFISKVDQHGTAHDLITQESALFLLKDVD